MITFWRRFTILGWSLWPLKERALICYQRLLNSCLKNSITMQNPITFNKTFLFMLMALITFTTNFQQSLANVVIRKFSYPDFNIPPFSKRNYFFININGMLYAQPLVNLLTSKMQINKIGTHHWCNAVFRKKKINFNLVKRFFYPFKEILKYIIWSNIMKFGILKRCFHLLDIFIHIYYLNVSETKP